MVVGVGIDLNFPLMDLPQNARPFRKLGVSIHDDFIPDLRLFLDAFALSEPSDIC